MYEDIDAVLLARHKAREDESKRAATQARKNKKRRTQGRDYCFADEGRALLRFDGMVVDLRAMTATLYQICNDDDDLDDLRFAGRFKHHIAKPFRDFDRKRVREVLRRQIEGVQRDSAVRALSMRHEQWTIEELARSLAAMFGKRQVKVSRGRHPGLDISIGTTSNYGTALRAVFRALDVPDDVAPFSVSLDTLRPARVNGCGTRKYGDDFK